MDYRHATEIARQRQQTLLEDARKDRQLKALRARRQQAVKVPFLGLAARLRTATWRLKPRRRYKIVTTS